MAIKKESDKNLSGVNPHTFPRGIKPRGKDLKPPFIPAARPRGILEGVGIKELLRDLFIIFISVSVLYIAIAAYAGSLVPPGPVGPTMMTLEDIYNALAGTYDSSAVTPNSNGNAMELLKCITTKMNGGVCI